VVLLVVHLAAWGSIFESPAAWLVFGIIDGAVLCEFLFAVQRRSLVYRLIAVPLYSVAVVLIVGGVLWTYLGTRAKLTTEGRFRHGAVSLDGFAYKAKIDQYEYLAQTWINENIAGRPRILEAIPDVPEYYDDHMQVVMNTGLATLAGWNSHISQWNSAGGNIVERRRDARTIYDSTDVSEAIDLLYKYEIKFIYIGRQERKKYDNRGFSKFDLYPQFFNLRYANPGVKIYEVIFRQPEGPEGEKVRETARVSDNVFVGGLGKGQAQFSQPAQVAVDAQGNFFIADSANNRVQVFSSNGSFQRVLGEGVLKAPKGLAVAEDGALHVVDHLNDRVCVFNPAGRFERAYGEGELFWPVDLAFDARGQTWVSDAGNGRVVVFAPGGEVVRVVGEQGRGEGEFRMPLGMALGRGMLPEDATPETVAPVIIWVHDLGNGRVLGFDETGRPVAGFEVGVSPDLTAGAPFLAVGPKYELYLTDPRRDLVEVYRPDGTLSKVLEATDRRRDWRGPTGIAFDRAGNGFIVSSQAGKLARYERIVGASMFKGVQGDAPGQFNEPRDLTCDRRGNVYVADFRNFRIQKFDKNGEFILSWGEGGDADGQFKDPCGVAVSPDGKFVYVADTWNFRLQKFDQNGKFLAKWPNFNAPRGIAVGPQGNVYVAESGATKIVVLSPEGRRLREFGRSRSDAPGDFSEPIGIFVSADEKVYVADTWNRRVQVLTTAGRFLRAYPVPGWQEGESFREPYVEAHGGFIYVTDPPRNRVLRIDEETGEVAASSAVAGAQGRLNVPIGLAIGPDGTIFVTDTWNHRVVTIPRESFRPLQR
jgi:tripartite motif-containing protein 71